MYHNFDVMFLINEKNRDLDSIAALIASSFRWNDMQEFEQIIQLSMYFYRTLDIETKRDVYFIYPLLPKICRLIHMLPRNKTNSLLYLRHFNVFTSLLVQNVDLYNYKFQNRMWLQDIDPRWVLIIHKLIRVITDSDNCKISLLYQIISNPNTQYHPTSRILFREIMQNIDLLIQECNPKCKIIFNDYRLNQIWQLCYVSLLFVSSAVHLHDKKAKNKKQKSGTKCHYSLVIITEILNID